MDVVSRKIIVTRNATIRDTFSVRVNKLRGNREVFTWILAVPGLIRAISPDGGIQVCVCVYYLCLRLSQFLEAIGRVRVISVKIQHSLFLCTSN